MTLMWKEILEEPEAIQRCSENNIQVIKDLVKDIKSKNIHSIVIAARGTSDHAAVYGKYIFEMMTGLPVSLAAPSVFTMYNKTLKLENCLVIGISQSGEAADAIEVMKAANACGAITAAITNFTDSPMATISKYHLFCSAGVEKSVAATKTFITQLYLLALLAQELTEDNEFKIELSLLPAKITRTLELGEQIKEKVQRYRFMNECFVLARGLNYSVALEAALKIQETNYVRAKAYATSDFHHGPFAMIDKDMPVIIFAPKGPSQNDVMEMIKKIKNTGAELIIFSNNEDLESMADCFFKIPYTENDMISPFLNVVAAQMFACQLALAKGLNPDEPRGLKKVTITR